MTKQDFIAELQNKLRGLPEEDIEERLNFYSEIIDDRIEEGYTEQEAVSGIGSVDEISAQIISDIPLAKIAKEKIYPKRRLKAWEILLLALGSPIWIPLIAAAFVVIISIYTVIWSVLFSLWAVFVALVACALGGTVAGGALSFSGNGFGGIAIIGASIVCAGLAILLFFGCKAATKGIIILTKKIALSIKKRFMGKENV